MNYKTLTEIYYQVDVKHLQQQHDELQQRQSKSEASLEDMACFYYKLNNKTKDIMDELGEINRKVRMIFGMSIGSLELV